MEECNCKIPMFIGITGHRNFRREGDDEFRLRAAVKAALIDIMSGCKNTEFILLSALSAGADQLAAEVAAELHDSPKKKYPIKYAAVLPMPADIYFNRVTEDGPDFTDAEKENAFRLLNDSLHSAFTYVIPYEYCDGVQISDENVCETKYANVQYCEVARFISDNSCAGLALWDGLLDVKAVAGTGPTVRDSLHGKTYRSSYVSGITIPETRPIFHIFTPRVGDRRKSYDYMLRKLYPEPLLETGDNWFTLNDCKALEKERGAEAADAMALNIFSGKPDKVFRKREANVKAQFAAVDCFNGEVISKSVSAAVEKPHPDLLLKNPSVRSKLCEAYFTASDQLSIEYKKKRQKWGLLIIALATISYICLNIFSDLSSNVVFLTGYLLLLGFTYLVWLLVESRALHRRYTEYRALAEGLRVQYFWHSADIADNRIPSQADKADKSTRHNESGRNHAQVENFYLRKQKSKIEWIRTAIRNINLLAEVYERSTEQCSMRCVTLADVRNVADTWLGKMYVEGADGKWRAPEKKEGESDSQEQYFLRKAVVFDNQAKKYRNGSLAAILGSFALALALLVILLLYPEFLNTLIGSLFVFITGLLPVIAMSLMESNSFMGFEDDSKRYAWYQRIYMRAIVEIDEVLKEESHPESEKIEAVQTKLLEIGKEALIENADWVLLNADRAPSVPLN